MGFSISAVVGWLAGKISNPLVRLRFLRAMMLPSPERYRRRRSYAAWFQASFVVIWLLFTAPASAPWVRGANGISRPTAAARILPMAVVVKQTPEIWQVERTDAFETYSNGLRIDNRFCIGNRRRSYLAISATLPD